MLKATCMRNRMSASSAGRATVIRLSAFIVGGEQ